MIFFSKKIFICFFSFLAEDVTEKSNATLVVPNGNFSNGHIETESNPDDGVNFLASNRLSGDASSVELQAQVLFSFCCKTIRKIFGQYTSEIEISFEFL